MARVALISLVLAAGCAGQTGDPTTPGASGVPVLGGGTHTLASVDVAVVADADDGLSKPRDLAFHPDDPDELWVVNQADESVTLVWDLDDADPSSRTAWESTGEHFLASPSGIAFGENGNFATIHDLYEETQGGSTGPDFMGPTLWDGDSDSFDGGHESHLDMLHNSPEGKGIAWDSRNRYWVFDGLHESITMYDFHDDHGLGGVDHADGEVARYVEGEVSPRAAVPSHLEIDRETGLLYAIDPGNDRVAVLDTTVGDRGPNVEPNFDGTDQYAVENATLDTWVDTAAEGIGTPIGIAIAGGLVYVSSVDPSAIHAFDMAGVLQDWVALDGEPNGIEVADDGSLYYVDPKADEVVRLRP